MRIATKKTEKAKGGKRRRGQLLIPSLLVIPSLLLFVYLLFETAKLSREKIRQQFAVDSAAFIQMGDYTNLLNRTAYVNGAFPYRIFKEAFECPGTDPGAPNLPFHYAKDPGGPDKICSYQILFEGGVYPKYQGSDPDSSFDNKPRWEIAFNAGTRPEFDKNPTSRWLTPLVDIVTADQASKILVPWTSTVGYFQFYHQVYSLLGNVEKSQWTVFERLTKEFNFFRKSYFLNANVCKDAEAASCGEDGVSSSGGFKDNRLDLDINFFMHYVDKIKYRGRYDNPADPYDFGMSIGVNPDPGFDTKTMNPPDGLFQLATVTEDKLKTFGDGIHVYQGWDVPSNYFKVEFNKRDDDCVGGEARPCVHALVATQCPGYRKSNKFTEDNNCVWPDPTPKYQTRLYP